MQVPTYPFIVTSSRCRHAVTVWLLEHCIHRDDKQTNFECTGNCNTATGCIAMDTLQKLPIRFGETIKTIKEGVPILTHLLKNPLQGNGGIPEEGLRTGGVAVIDEVVGELPLRTHAQMLVEVIPQLRLAKDDQTAMAVGLLATPEVDEAREGELLARKLQSPDTRQLCTGIGVGVVVALEELLVKELHGPRLREVGGMAIVGSTHEC